MFVEALLQPGGAGGGTGCVCQYYCDRNNQHVLLPLLLRSAAEGCCCTIWALLGEIPIKLKS